MIIGAFYWAFLFFGAIVVLLSAFGVLAQLQDRPLDLGSIAIAVVFGGFGVLIAIYSGRALLRGSAGIVGARVGPEFERAHFASSGCLFVILVVGLGLILSGPMILFQVPAMAAQDQSSFGFGAAASIVVGALLVAPAGLVLWRRRQQQGSTNQGSQDAGDDPRDE